MSIPRGFFFQRSTRSAFVETYYVLSSTLIVETECALRVDGRLI